MTNAVTNLTLLLHQIPRALSLFYRRLVLARCGALAMALAASAMAAACSRVGSSGLLRISYA